MLDVDPEHPRKPDDGLPPLIRLDEFLATPDEDITYRVDQLWPVGGRVVLAAAWKAGKTTLLGNLIRALVDNQPFLGRYIVQTRRPCRPHRRRTRQADPAPVAA
jgi:transcription termination factor Rho